MERQKDFKSVVGQYEDKEKIGYWSNNHADKNQSYCVISVNKSFDSSTVWDFYFFNKNKIDDLAYIPAVRNFRVRDIKALFIGNQTNEDWFAVTTSQGHSIRRPWNNVSLIKMITDLCQRIDYHEGIDTGDLCSTSVN